MGSLASSAAIYLCAAALNAMVPFFVLPLLARWLGPAAFGVVGSYLAIVNIASVVAGLSVQGIISVIHYGRSPDAVPAYVNSSLKILVFTGAPLIVFLFLLGGFFEPLTAVPSQWLWTAGLVAIGQFVVNVGLAVFQAREQPWKYGSLQVGLTLGWGLLSLLFVGKFHWGWVGRAAGQLVAVSLSALVTLYWLNRQRLMTSRSGAAPLSTLLRFGVPLLPHSLAAAVMAGADRLLIAGMVSAEVSGQYFAAFQMAAVITVAAAAINQAWVPWLYRRLAQPSEERSIAVVRVTYIMYFLLLGGAFVLILLSPWIVPFVAGERYARAVPLLRWLAPAAAMSGMYYFVTNYIFYAGRTGLLSVITVSCSIVQVSLMLVCVPRWGAEGAAVSVFMTSLVYWISTWIAAHRTIPMPWSLRVKAVGRT